LIELLVVIAILGLLCAMLIPTLSYSLGAARKAQCLNNHRQMHLAWNAYAEENEGRLVPTVDHGDGLPFTNWVAGNLQKGKEGTDSSLLLNKSRSLLAPHLSSPKVYKCPADRSSLVRSVSMNNRLNPVRPGKEPLVLGGYGTNFMVYRKLSQISLPTGIFVILDERHDSINEGNFAVDLSNTGTLTGEGSQNPFWWIDTPGSYHNKALALSFADGHAETHLWKEPSTLGPIGITGARHTRTTDQDIQWLQERTAELTYH